MLKRKYVSNPVTAKLAVVVLFVMFSSTALGSMEQREFAKSIALLNLALEKCAVFLEIDQPKLRSIVDEWKKVTNGPDRETFLETFNIVSQIEQRSYERFPKIYCEATLPVLQESFGELSPVVLRLK
jgi:hypothetical protein